MNWGKWIIVAFVLFAGFIGTLVAVCVRQDISLVSKDYYKEELEYESQLVRIQNVSLLETKPVITVQKNGLIQIVFDRFTEVQKGELKLFRPSDSSKDKTFNLTPASSTTQTFSTEALERGMYRARMQWTMDGKEFFLEEVVYI